MDCKSMQGEGQLPYQMTNDLKAVKGWTFARSLVGLAQKVRKGLEGPGYRRVAF